MIKFVLTLFVLLLPAMEAHTQSKVTVTQSAAIDAVVNGKKSPQSDKNMSRKERRAAKKAEKERKRQEKIRQKNQKLTVPSQPKSASQHSSSPKVQVPISRSPSTSVPRVTVKESTPSSSRDNQQTVLVRRPIRRQVGTETRLVLRRKKPRTGKGFRIVVFSGGNTREDRNNAEQAGQKVKSALPEQPIYVHFYSPRWMCLVGNFETYKETQKALPKVRKAGYKSACIIRK